jgi:flagellar motor switch protein FliN
MVDQSDIDALLASATSLAEEAGQEAGAAAPPIPPRPIVAEPGRPNPAARTDSTTSPRSGIQRILRMRVPVIVKLAEREMKLEDMLKWSIGSIVEFEQASDSCLDLVVANDKIGVGQAVKVGENFGLRILRIGDLRERIEALGPR